MKLTIRTRGMTLERSLRDWATRKLRLALGRFAGRVERVELRLADENGPKGGEDKRGRVVMSLRGHGTMVAEADGAQLEAVVEQVSDRAYRRIERALARQGG